MLTTLIRACSFAMIALTVAAAASGQRSTPVQLLHPMGAAGDQFGQAVAISGQTMIVGTPFDDVGSNADQGSAQVYHWTGTGWAFEATLTAADGAALDRFGISVALVGDVAIVGAYLDNVGANGDQGSAYIFTRSGTTWTQQAQLTAADGAASDAFGISVALGGVGDTAVVGAYLDNIGANGDQGSAYVFTRSGTAWTQQAQLTASDGAASDSFGITVAVSGNTAIIGAYLDNVGAAVDQGSAYIFTRSGTTWSQRTQLLASDGASGDHFGISVAISGAGNTAIIGADRDNGEQGSAYIFTGSGAIWTQQAHLTAADGAALDRFGISVALGATGDTAIVGAYLDNIGASGGDQGSAYVFTRSGTTWTQQTHVTGPDSAAGDYFGYSVALGEAGDTAVVGARLDNIGANGDQGAAWVFKRVGSTWIGPDHQVIGADSLAGDNLGGSVAVSGDILVAGAGLDDVGANADQGSAYVYTRLGPGSPWLQETQLLASDGAALDNFGQSVAVSGNTAVIGSPNADTAAGSGAGAVYVFTRSGAVWTQQQKITASDAAALDAFGFSVGISGNTLIVGARGDDIGANSAQGSAYIFVRSGSTWSLQQKLTVSNGAANDEFGFSVAIDGDDAIVGAPLRDSGSIADAGSAYRVTRSGTTWSQPLQVFGRAIVAGNLVGYAVAVSGGTFVVSAIGDDFPGGTNQGSLWVFGANSGMGLVITPTDGRTGDSFGTSIGISGSTLIAGASGVDVGANTDQGAAYIFARLGSGWGQAEKLTAPDGDANDRFGNAAAISSDTVVVGAPLDDVGANSGQGSAYAYGVVHADLPIVQGQITTVFSPAWVSGQFVNVGPPPNMQPGAASVRRLSDGQLISTSTGSSISVDLTQTFAAGGGQTGGGFVDGALRVAETSGGVALSFGVTPAGATLIDIHAESRLFLATGYAMVGTIGTSIAGQPASFDISESGPMQFATYYTGTPSFFTGTLAAVSGGASINGNILTPGRYSVSAPFPNTSLTSTTPPQDVQKEGVYRIVILKRCFQDFNDSGAVSTQDLFDFLAAYFGGDPRADVNAVSGLSVQDIFDFLAAYFTPC